MTYEERLCWLRGKHRELLERKNVPVEGNGIFERYEYPVLTAEHAPLEWRYDLNRETNPLRGGRPGRGRRPEILLRRGRKSQWRG